MSKRIAPGLRQYLPLPFGLVTKTRKEPLRFYIENHRRFGEVFRYQIGPHVFHSIRHPDHVKYVLQDRYKNFPRSRFYDFLKLILGNGLVTSDGEPWLKQRRLAQPAFSRPRLANLVPLMADATAAMLERWQPFADNGQPFDAFREMMRLALQIAGKTLFSIDTGGQVETVANALPEAMSYVDYRINQPIGLPLWVPTPWHIRVKKAMKRLDDMVFAIIEERRRLGKDLGDLFSALMLARDEETGEGMTDRMLRDQVMTFILAGHETTATTMAWTWYVLSKHPEVERRVRAEVQQVLGQRTVAAEDLPRLQYTKMVIEESMRMYPPVWGMLRDAKEDEEIGGFHIPARSIIAIPTYATHHHEDFWENPEGFDPERFTPDKVARRPRYAYFPFAGGPHQCIGNEFALMEAQLIVAMVVQRYRLELLPGHTVIPLASLTLRPKPGVMVTLHRAK